jgi:radical SAM-linked protein
MAFSNGWSHIKLYFMIGLPTERREDVEAILEMGRKCHALGRRHQGRRAKLTLSASSFIPKPFTPFQWSPMAGLEEIREKQSWLKAGCEETGIRFKWHHPELSRLEGVFSLGDRSLGDVVEAAYRRGCAFDGWTERMDLEAWNAAFADCGIDPETYLTRSFGPRDALPWDHLDIGVTRKFLARELESALAEREDETCGGDNCYGCAPFASSCTGFLHSRRAGEAYFGRTREPAAVPATGPAGEPSDAEPTYRYRIQFTKEGNLRFLSHLDVTRLLSRAFRRARVPTAYSRGYHPMPKMAFGPALPVGIASQAEFLDLETTLPLRPDRFLERMRRELPRGIRFLAMAETAPGADSLSKVVNRVIYSARIPAPLVSRAVASLNGGGEGPPDPADHEAVLRRLLERKEIPYTRVRERKTKTVDLRCFLRDLSLGDGAELRLDLEMDNGRSAKPHELLEVLYGDGSDAVPVVRREQLVMRGTKALSPLLAAGRGMSGTRDPG